MEEDYEYNKFYICPNNCSYIPEISYYFEPMNSKIKYNCSSQKHGNIEENLKLEDFLTKATAIIECSFCNNIIQDKEFILLKNTKQFFHNNCFNNRGYSIEKDFLKINSNYLFNTCLAHNRKFIFYCFQCKTPLCSDCDIEGHDQENHSIKQLSSLRENKNKEDKFKSIIKKQRILLNKVKDMNNKLIQSLENDIEIKENILKNYENNKNNYSSILNFNNFEVNNIENFEKILNDISNKYDEFGKNVNSKNSEEIFVNTIVGPLYYSIMINNNNNYNKNITNLIYKKIENLNKFLNSEENKNIKLDKEGNINSIINEEKNKNIADDENKDNFADSENSEDEECVEEEEEELIEKKEKIKKEDKFNSMEILNIKQEKSIFNMIILHTGNIATSSMGSIMIYDTNNLLSLEKDKYLLQKINISKNKKISYIYEFPDETLFFSAYNKIFHLKLIDNDKKYNILGIIELQKFELPSKLISIGDSILAALIVVKGNSLIKLFIKMKDSDKKLFSQNYDDNNENYNSDDQSAGLLNSDFDCIDKKEIGKDKEFYPYSKNNNLNIDKKLLCSIFEIKKNFKNFGKNECKYEFISTSNSTYDYGEDKLEFYNIKHNKDNENIEFKVKKKIDKLSCSTEADSICQLNKQFICVGLQNHNKKDQINGFAIINIAKRDIKMIIEDLPIYSLSFNFENKILYSALDEIEGNKHNYLIKLYEVVEGMEEIYLNNIYEFKTEHKNIIVSLSELKNEADKNKDKSLIIATSSIDSTLRLFKINNSKKN